MRREPYNPATQGNEQPSANRLVAVN